MALVVDGSSNATTISATFVEVLKSEDRKVKPMEESSSLSAMTNLEIAIFMNEVASLVK